MPKLKIFREREGEYETLMLILFNINLHNVWHKQNSGSNKKNVCVRKFLRFLLYFQFSEERRA